MSESNTGGGGSILQRLLAGHFQNVDGNGTTNTPGNHQIYDPLQVNSTVQVNTKSESETAALGRNDKQDKPFEDACSFNSTAVDSRPDHRLNSAHFRPTTHPGTPRNDDGAAARLDALCRSTLETSNEKTIGKNISYPEQIIDGNLRGKAANVTKLSPEDSFISTPKTRSAAHEVLARYRKEFQENNRPREQTPGRPPPPSYQEAKLDADQYKTVPENGKHNPFVSGTPTVSPRCRLPDQKTITRTMQANSSPSARSPRNSQAGMQLNGHPKSNSGGDEYYYTDHIRVNNQKRGIRSKKNGSNVKRSSSLHQNKDGFVYLKSLEEQSGQSGSNQQSTPLERLDFCSGLSGLKNSNLLQNSSSSQHKTSKSAPNQCTNKLTTPEVRRFSMQSGNSCGANAPGGTSKDTQESYQKNTTNQNNEAEKYQGTMPHTPNANQSSYIRPTGKHNGSSGGSFYPAMSLPMVNPTTEVTSSNHTPLLNALSGVRPPPPPYPASMMVVVDPNLRGATETGDNGFGHPQRPNSLALGQFSKKRNGSSDNLQNSPGLTSPTGAFNTPMRGTPFYSGAKESPYSQQQSAQFYVGGSHINNSSHQVQGPSGSYLRRSGSGNSGRNVAMATASSSSSSTATAVSTPSYPDAQSFPDPGLRSPVTPYNVHSVIVQGAHGQGYVQEGYGAANNSGVTKSDSINSSSSTTSSGGASRMARRRKRNSSSKSSYGNASGSGSSSSTGGSRPNSTADLTERLLYENESYRKRLDAALQKLMRFEEIEHDLKRINQDHQALQHSANKREMLEKEMRNQLTAKLQRVERERDSFENKVMLLTERLQTMDMTSSMEESNVVTRESGVIENYEAKNRKLAEKERQLQEELEEYRERLSEEKVDNEHLRTSLEKAEGTIRVIKEKFLQDNKVDVYTEQLSEHLGSLQKIIDERLEIERELRNRLRRQLTQQRPSKSTSSNDEGISEMDVSDLAVNLPPIEVYSNREGQMLGAKAEMLKWQHMYIEHGLLHYVQSKGKNRDEPKRLYKALRNHRHTASDPGFDKLSLRKCILPFLNEQAESRDRLSSCETESRAIDHEDLVNFDNADFVESKKHCHQIVSASSFPNGSGSSKTDCACQTPDESKFLNEISVGQDSLCEKVLPSDLNATTSECGSQTGDNVITSTPSEGYHSQQSSGSPTPNTERSSVHFPVPAESVCPSTRDIIHVGPFRRNRSADVLTSMNA
ncbi:uncharacterized protein LOC143448940 [Clavelina lepadiformis]|uniref:uncharacterized protein LOC143448940 n=1 Tax=Clavelina lepadiformis TaxID=159417 RepID=UPI0040438678